MCEKKQVCKIKGSFICTCFLICTCAKHSICKLNIIILCSRFGCQIHKNEYTSNQTKQRLLCYSLPIFTTTTTTTRNPQLNDTNHFVFALKLVCYFSFVLPHSYLNQQQLLSVLHYM